MDKYKRLGDYEPTAEEFEAGIERLSSFGSWGTATAYARRSNMKTKDVFELSAGEVYTTLLLDFEESELQKRLHEIHKRNLQFNKET